MKPGGDAPKERDYQDFLCLYPELIDDDFFGIREGMEAVYGASGPFLKRELFLPSRRRADMTIVEPERVTVVELKKIALKVTDAAHGEDVVEQVVAYLKECRSVYPGRAVYRGFVIGMRVQDREELAEKIRLVDEDVTALVLGLDIPLRGSIRFCVRCNRAVSHYRDECPCGALLR